MRLSVSRTTTVENLDPAVLRERAAAFARAEGYALTNPEPSLMILSRGVPWSLHKDALRHWLVLRGAEAATEIEIGAFAPFWPGPRLQRFVERRLEDFGKAVSIQTGPGPSRTGRIQLRAGPVRPCFFLSAAASMLCAVLAAWIFGWAAAESARSDLLESIAAAGTSAVFLPGREILLEMPLLDRLLSGLFFAIPLGLISSLACMPFLVAAESSRHWSVWLPAAALGTGLVLAAVAAPGGAFPSSLLLAFGPPAAAAGWSLTARRRLGEIQPFELCYHAGTAIAFAALAALLLLVATGGDRVFTGARDRFLLGNAPGRALCGFYYRHSPLAARAIQSPLDPNRQKVFRAFFGPDGPDPAALRALRRESGVLSHDAPSGPPELPGPGPGVDVVLADESRLAEAGSARPLVLLLRPESPAPAEGQALSARRGDERGLREAFRSALARLAFPENLAFLSLSGSVLAAVCLPAVAWVLLASLLAWSAQELRTLFRRRGRPFAGRIAFLAAALLAAASVLIPPFLVLPGQGARTARNLRWGGGEPAASVDGLVGLMASGDGETSFEAAAALSHLLADWKSKAMTGGIPELERFVQARDSFAEPTSKYGKILFSALEDPDPRVRMWAASGLGTIGQEAAAQELVRLMRSDPVINVRYKAAQALGGLRDPAALAALAETARDASAPWYVRLHALRAAETER